jgi:uncharacterized glyoxalase superfamily protein PhnB
MSENLRDIYPILRYADARAAIDWLTKAFGLTVRMVSDRPDGTVGHAELECGRGILMLGQRDADDRPRASGPTAWVVYVAVADVDEHHDHAVASGAEIVRGLTDQPYGSREYDARDCEGNLWSFGTYRP